MQKLIDLPIGLIITLEDKNPFYINWMALNEISGGLLWNGNKKWMKKKKSKK